MAHSLKRDNMAKNTEYYVQCPKCFKIRELSRRGFACAYTKNSGMCMSCATKGKNNPRYNKEVSKETRNKMSKCNSGKNNPNYGKKATEETLKKRSISMTGKNSGSNHPNWKGGTSSINARLRMSIHGVNWKKNIFKRDDYTCSICNKRGVELNAHHLKPFAELLNENNIITVEEGLNNKNIWDINNGITCCKSCHKEIHRLLRRSKYELLRNKSHT